MGGDSSSPSGLTGQCPCPPNLQLIGVSWPAGQAPALTVPAAPRKRGRTPCCAWPVVKRKVVLAAMTAVGATGSVGASGDPVLTRAPGPARPRCCAVHSGGTRQLAAHSHGNCSQDKHAHVRRPATLRCGGTWLSSARPGAAAATPVQRVHRLLGACRLGLGAALYQAAGQSCRGRDLAIRDRSECLGKTRRLPGLQGHAPEFTALGHPGGQVLKQGLFNNGQL